MKASAAESRRMEYPVLPSSCVTPAGTSIEVQNEWEENTHTHTQYTTDMILGKSYIISKKKGKKRKKKEKKGKKREKHAGRPGGSVGNLEAF